MAADFNEKAFINCHNYENFDEVIEVIKRIDQDEKLYEKYLREPIGTEMQFPEDPLKMYRKYIVEICKQSPEKAFRRNNILVGERYQRQMKELRFPKKKARVKKICRRIKKIIKSI